MRASTKQQGFSLIELMIVVVIIGVISAIAIPSYKKHVVDTRRTEAQSALLALANAIERQRLRTGTYLGVATNNIQGEPTMFATEAPLDSPQKFYDLRVDFTATTYTVYAIPKSGTAQAGNGSLSLSSTGERKWDKDNTGSFASAVTW